MVNFKSQSLYVRGCSSWCPMDKRLGGSHNRFTHCAPAGNRLPVVHLIVTILIELSRRREVPVPAGTSVIQRPSTVLICLDSQIQVSDLARGNSVPNSIPATPEILNSVDRCREVTASVRIYMAENGTFTDTYSI
jgi:hypothetical protein